MWEICQYLIDVTRICELFFSFQYLHERHFVRNHKTATFASSNCKVFIDINQKSPPSPFFYYKVVSYKKNPSYTKMLTKNWFENVVKRFIGVVTHRTVVDDCNIVLVIKWHQRTTYLFSVSPNQLREAFCEVNVKRLADMKY